MNTGNVDSAVFMACEHSPCWRVTKTSTMNTGCHMGVILDGRWTWTVCTGLNACD